MKTVIGMAILAAAVGTAAVAAQPAKEGHRGGRGQHMQAMADYLGLSQQQQDEWRALSRKHREEMQPLREEGRTLRQRVEQAIESDEPDAVVGEAVKAVHAHRQAMKAAREAFEAQLVSLLDEEQKVKFEAFKAARRMDGPPRRGRGHHGQRDGARGSGGPGSDAPPVEG